MSGGKILFMNLKPIYFGFLALIMGVMGTGAAKSLSIMPETDSAEYIDWMKKNLHFYENWYCSKFADALTGRATSPVQAKIRIAPSGVITYISIVKSSGSPRVDFTCLESLASNAPFEPMPKKRHSYVASSPQERERGLPEPDNYAPERYSALVNFSDKDQPKPWIAEESLWAKHPNLKDNSYTMHLIPLGINKHYPNLFTEAELISNENLVVLKQFLEPDEVLEPFLADWQSFIRSNKTATKNDVLKAANAIKAKHSDLLAKY